MQTQRTQPHRNGIGLTACQWVCVLCVAMTMVIVLPSDPLVAASELSSTTLRPRADHMTVEAALRGDAPDDMDIHSASLNEALTALERIDADYQTHFGNVGSTAARDIRGADRIMLLRGLLVEQHFWRLRLLRAVGLLHEGVRLFNPLSGVDLYPGIDAARMWTCAKDTSKEQLLELFTASRTTLHHIASAYGHDLLGIWASEQTLQHLGDKIVHTSTDVLHDASLIPTWTAQMRPGDVVWLKFVPENLTWFGAEQSDVMIWLDAFLTAIPVGVYVVIVEKSSFLPQGLSGYVHHKESWQFADHTLRLLSDPDQRTRWEHLNQCRPTAGTLMSGFVQVGSGQDLWLGGRMAVLRKQVSTPILPPAPEGPVRPTHEVEQQIHRNRDAGNETGNDT